jgi:hypothetical protein
MLSYDVRILPIWRTRSPGFAGEHQIDVQYSFVRRRQRFGVFVLAAVAITTITTITAVALVLTPCVVD